MITFLGFIIFATVIAIGAADRNSGLGVFQKYESPWGPTGRPRDASVPSRQRRGRDS
jgi:hypothetical protein